MKLIYLLFLCTASLLCLSQENIQRTNFSPNQLKEDLNFLFKNLEDIHPNLYHTIPKSTVDKMRKDISGTLTKSMNRKEFALKIIPIVSALKDGHTRLLLPREERREYLDKGGTIFPFTVIIKRNQVLIRSNLSFIHSIKIGSEIKSINGIPSEEILENMRKFKSAELEHFKNNLVGQDFGRLLWYLYGFEKNYMLELSYGDETYNRVVQGIDLNNFNKITMASNSTSKPPSYSYRQLKGKPIGVIDFSRMANREKFKHFLDSTFTSIDNNSVKYLVIDIRKNGGGDSRLADMLFNYITDRPYKMTEKVEIKASKQAKQQIRNRNIKWYLYPIVYPAAIFFRQAHPYFYTKNGKKITLKQKKLTRPKKVSPKFKGKTFLLTSSFTFSSANMLAIAFKCYQMGIIVGEETGGPLIAYGDLINIELPNSKLIAYCSHKKFVHSCYDSTRSGVIPDITIEPKVEDVQMERDAAIEYIKSTIQNNPPLEN